MKKILTLSLLFVSISSFAQKINLLLNLKQDSTYYLTTNATITITEKINGQEQIISTIISARVAHKVIAIKDTIYEMEVRYLGMSMHKDVAGTKIDFNSDDKNSGNISSKILSSMLNKPFSMTMSRTGKVKEIKGTDILYAHMFDSIPQVTEAKKTQFKTQMQQSFGEKAFKGNFQDAFAMFPNMPVGPNDKWVANSSLESIIAIQIKTTYILQDITDHTIMIRGDAKIHSDGSASYKPNNGFTMRFTNVEGSAASEIKLDKNSGWITEAKISKIVKGTVEVEDTPKTPGGIKFPTSIIVDVTMRSR